MPLTRLAGQWVKEPRSRSLSALRILAAFVAFGLASAACGSSSAEAVAVPDVVDEASDFAAGVLTGAGLDYVIETDTSGDGLPGRIVSQTPEAGTPAEPGAVVTLFEGAPATVTERAAAPISTQAPVLLEDPFEANEVCTAGERSEVEKRDEAESRIVGYDVNLGRFVRVGERLCVPTGYCGLLETLAIIGVADPDRLWDLEDHELVMRQIRRNAPPSQVADLETLSQFAPDTVIASEAAKRRAAVESTIEYNVQVCDVLVGFEGAQFD